MKTTSFLIIACLTFSAFSASSQAYHDPTAAPAIGKAPGMKFKIVGTTDSIKTYAIVFAHGDEIFSGLTDFAIRNSITCAHFTAIGDASSAKVGWYDKSKKKFKILTVGEAEITSLVGDVAVRDGKPVVHGHINLAAEDGIVHGGHLIEAYVGPTLEVFLTAYPGRLEKKIDKEYGAAVIKIEQ